MRGWDGTPLAELANERREILPFDRFPPQLVHAFLAAEDRRFYEHQGLDYRGIARALGANLRAGEVAQGGLHHHAAGGEVVPVVGADDPAKDPRGDPGPPPRAPVLEARDPDALPQPGLPRPRRLRRGGGGAHLLRQADRGSRSRRDGAPGRPRPRAVALLAAHQPRRRAHAPRSGAGRDGRLRLSHRRRGQPLAGAAGDHPPAPRLLPHRHPLLRRARPPRHHPPLRREEALRRGPRHRDLRSPLGRHRRAGERRLLAAQARQAAGVARSGRAPHRPGRRRVPPPRRRPLRRRAADRGAPLSGPRRRGDRRRQLPRARRRGRLPLAVRQHAVGRPLERQGRRQRQEARFDGGCPAHRRRHLGEERAPVEACAVLRLDLRQQERGAVAPRL